MPTHITYTQCALCIHIHVHHMHAQMHTYMGTHIYIHNIHITYKYMQVNTCIVHTQHIHINTCMRAHVCIGTSIVLIYTHTHACIEVACNAIGRRACSRARSRRKIQGLDRSVVELPQSRMQANGHASTGQSTQTLQRVHRPLGCCDSNSSWCPYGAAWRLCTPDHHTWLPPPPRQPAGWLHHGVSHQGRALLSPHCQCPFQEA